MTVAYKGIGTGANGSTSVGPTCPATVDAGDLLIAIITSGATNNETPTAPDGTWTSLGSYTCTDGGSFGVDTGARRVTAFYKTAAGTEDSSTVTFSITNGNTCRGTILSFSKTAAAWDVTATGGNDNSSGTGVSIAGGAVQWKVGQCTVVGVAQLVDNATQSSQSLTATGVTFGTRSNRASSAVTTGNDHRHVIDTYAATTAGNTSTAPTWAYTASANVVAAAIIILVGELEQVSSGVGALTLTGFAPTVFVPDPKTANPGAGDLTLTGFAPTLAINKGISPGVGALSLAGFDPTTNRLRISWVDFEIPAQDPVSITADVGALSLTGYSPTVFAADPKTANPGVGALALTGFEPTPAIGGGISPNITTDVGALTLTGYSPTAGKTESVTADVGALTLAGYVPTAQTAGSERLRVSWVDLEIPAQDPVAITAGVGALTLTGYEPTPSVSSVGGSVSIPTGVGALTLAGVEPSVRRDWTVAAGFGALTITGYGPTLQDSGATERLRVSWVDLETPAATSLTVYPGAGALSFTGHDPTPIVGGVAPIIPTGVGTLTFAGQVPAAFVSGVERLRVSWVDLETPAAQSITAYPGVGALTVTGYAPYINETARTANPGVADLTIGGFAPRNTYTLPSPVNATLTLAGFAPSLGFSAFPGVGTLTLVGKNASPVLDLPPNLDARPSEGDLDLTGFAPDVRNDITAQPDVGALTIGGYAPVLDIGFGPDVGALTVEGFAPSIYLQEQIWLTPDVGGLTIEGHAPTTMHGGAWAITPGTASLTLTGYANFSADQVPETNAGGWNYGFQARRRTPLEIQRDRERFGVLPKTVQKALQRAANLVVRKVATDDEAEALAQQILLRDSIRQVEAAAKAEIERAQLRWKQSYEYIVQALILQALEDERIRLEQAEAYRRQEEDDEAMAAAASVFLGWL